MNIQVIPAIDIINGQCVRLTKGDYSQKTVYDQDPLMLAQQFESLGFNRLHLVDLDGAKQKKVVNWETLEKICSNTSLLVDFGGGIQSELELEKAFDLGAYMVTCGSIAVKKPDEFKSWIDRFDPSQFILAADVMNGFVSVSGWLEQTQLSINDFLAEYLALGIRQVLCTDISKDGMLQGTSVALYEAIQQEFPEMNLIASGGVRGWEDVKILDDMGTFGVVVGKAIYEGKIDLTQWKNL